MSQRGCCTLRQNGYSRLGLLYSQLVAISYVLILFFLVSYNLERIWINCPSTSLELFFVALVLLKLILVRIKCCRILTSLLYLVALVGFVYLRWTRICRIRSYNLTDVEINFYGRFDEKLYAVGECLTGLKLSVGLACLLLFVELVHTSLTLVTKVVNNVFHLNKKWI